MAERRPRNPFASRLHPRNLISLARSAFFAAGLAALAACAPAGGGEPTPTLTPLPTPAPLNVYTTPALRPLVERLNACALETQGAALFLEERPASALPSLVGADRFETPGAGGATRTAPGPAAVVLLRLGEGPGEVPFAVSLGEERVQVIVHPENPVSSLDEDQLRGLFSGETGSWEAAGGPDLPVQPWVYPAGEEIQALFEEKVLAGAPVVSTAGLAPTPEQMLEAVAGDPGAVGFIPGSWLEDGVEPVSLPDSLQDSLQLPILAQVAAEPQGAAREFLSCLQLGR